jgi:indolepyruvate decarboxylase
MMTKQIRATTVIGYIVQRLAGEGITECFGVLGDYGLPICDAVERSPRIKWIGCSNDLNVSYTAVLAASVIWFFSP